MMKVTANYYQQFDADYSLDVPAEGYGGWKRAELEINLERTAVVIMHAWNTGTRQQYPGWYRAVEYMPRAQQICREVLPGLLRAVRTSGMPLFHVVGCGDYYKDYPAYKRTRDLAGPNPAAPEQIASDSTRDALQKFKATHVSIGPNNRLDAEGYVKNLDFAPEARPQGNEGIAENACQLFALCKDAGVNHLVYAGFAINWCVLLAPGGMADMTKRGLMCSAFRQAVTAVENKESAAKELCKEIALWRVAVAYGFVFDVDDFIVALRSSEGWQRQAQEA